ncbi:MAG TPA: type I DNA topoisomerase [Burkholderiales bacterium]|nr:type I DNA topoisomerase [Burkholderiales bacterium]
MSHSLLIVESPSKAKTLKKYLGRGFEITASYGHVRDLEAKEGAVDPSDDFSMRYALVDKNRKHVDAITKAVAKADTIYLATDPDREGEAIAWHLAEILKSKKLLKGKKLRRVVFYEITESAVKDAVAHPRDISMPLVNAQQARRALDHLVGFNISPLLWKKIGPSLSAGRVQSPALRLIVEREQEIENFNSREYWSVHLDSHKGKQAFGARLIQYRGDKIEQFSVATENQQKDLVADIEKAAKGSGKVIRVERKPRSRQPAPPFTTSTLQQEAVRKLGMTSRSTMSTAQQLYEGVDIDGGTVGLITYMRTDSFSLANEALQEIRGYIQQKFDSDYLPSAPIQYRSKSKNAQEAHEAIRPTSVVRTPDSVRKFLTADQAALYEMIWKRTVACQMTPAKYDTTSVDISVGHADTLFRATGQVLIFPGFMAVYLEDADDVEQEEEAKLPALEEKETIPVDRIFGEQHFTQPPPRYTEASLVKTLEEYGIGRPSTYANIVSTLQDRGYAVLEKKRFTPTDIGRLVNGFLTTHFSHYVDYKFTANLEEELDEISNGELDWVAVMREFWSGFSDNLDQKEGIERGIPTPEAKERVIDWNSYSKALLDPEWQKNGGHGEKCPKCQKTVLLQNSSRGLFFGCSGYPKCDYTRPWGGASLGPVVLGKDPATAMDILLLKGPYGHYVQLGQTIKDAKEKPKRAAWTKTIPVPTESSPEALALALKLLSLPRQLGAHPETGKAVEANIGRFGPYVKHDGMFKSIPKAENVHEISLDRAVQLLAEKKAAGGGGRALGTHPDDNKAVAVFSGRYGPYVKHGKVNATIPSSSDPEKITLEEALELLAAKEAKGGKGPKKKGGRGASRAKAPEAEAPAPAARKTSKAKPAVKAKPKKTVARKPAADKPAAKKPVAKRPAAKKPAAKKTA